MSSLAASDLALETVEDKGVTVRIHINQLVSVALRDSGKGPLPLLASIFSPFFPFSLTVALVSLNAIIHIQDCISLKTIRPQPS